jgi:hypothetical protein
MYTFESLGIKGHRDEPLPHAFLKQKSETSHLAVLLPGVGYTVHMPLLYYPMQVLLNEGADVLRVETMYVKRDAFEALSPADRARWVFEDASAAYRAAVSQRAYRLITLVGKSLGTLAMGHLLGTENRMIQVQALWLTPLLWNDTLCAQIEEHRPRSLFVAGTDDPHHRAEKVSEMQQLTQGAAVIVDGANHSLEIPGDLITTLKAMERVVAAVLDFVRGDSLPA